MALEGLYSVLPTAFSDSADDQDRAKVLETVIVPTGWRVPVVAGPMAYGTRFCIAYSRQAKDLQGAALTVARPVW